MVRDAMNAATAAAAVSLSVVCRFQKQESITIRPVPTVYRLRNILIRILFRLNSIARGIVSPGTPVLPAYT